MWRTARRLVLTVAGMVLFVYFLGRVVGQLMPTLPRPGAGASETQATPVPTFVPTLVPTPPPPTPTDETTKVETPTPAQRAIYNCDGARWVFERWHFDLGYVQQLGAGRLQLADGRILINCVWEKFETITP